jgi:hypothetical protein
MSDAFKPIDPVVDAVIGDRVVDYWPMFTRAFGGVNVGMLLSQFWNYSRMDANMGREGWFCASQEEIEEHTALTRPEQETARRKLRDAGILLENRSGIPARLWYKLNKERTMELLQEFLKQDEIRKIELIQKKDEKRALRANSTQNQESEAA